jgi:hypothetical protein
MTSKLYKTRRYYSKPWTPEEREHLQQLVQQLGRAWKAIALKMPGRTAEACKRVYEDRFEAQVRLARSDARRARERQAEHERAKALAHEPSITEAFFGDPLPGRSALDRKRAGTAEPQHFDRRTVHMPKKPTLYTGARP